MNRIGYTLLVGLFLGLVGDTHCRSAARRVSLAELEKDSSAPALIQAGIRAHLERPGEDLQPPAGAEPGEGNLDGEAEPLLPGSPSVPERPVSRRRRFWNALRSGITAPFRAIGSGWDWMRKHLRALWRAQRERRQAEKSVKKAVKLLVDSLNQAVNEMQRLSVKSVLEEGSSPFSPESRDLRASARSGKDLINSLLREMEFLGMAYPKGKRMMRPAMEAARKALEDLSMHRRDKKLCGCVRKGKCRVRKSEGTGTSTGPSVGNVFFSK
ncbi:hypothetical protein CSUI_007748 [Cystoisospora suis]|uniref:Transmembrane protein n=1 Tax=Cystoisospora suis TaxID=483139 RepID=A0A2C6KPM1_9APIC|nr:hypothetical protein CSUI_007748 [Cystoisospora suis]